MPPKPLKLSPSALQLMQDCERCFWLRRKQQWNRPQGPTSTLPNGFDRLLKNYFDAHLSGGTTPPEIAALGPGYRLYDNVEQLRTWRSNFKGVQWSDEHGNVLCGALDHLLVKDDKLVVLDFKTRGFPVKEVPAAYQLQLDIYNFLLRQNQHATHDYAYLAFYIPQTMESGSRVRFKSELYRRDVDPENARTAFTKGIEVLAGDCPSTTCEWCKYVPLKDTAE